MTIPERSGYRITNVRDAQWVASPDFGKRVLFEQHGERFPHLGFNLAILEPGKPACCYHRESTQENFLVLSGECVLVANGEEHRLRAWDFVYCPPGTSHVFVGAGEGPCVVLMTGARSPDQELFYPPNDIARKYGAEAAEPTDDPKKAYANAQRPAPCDVPDDLASMFGA